MNVGRVLKMTRAAKNMRQTELAKKLGLSHNYISLVEQGKSQPSYQTILLMAKNLKISPALFIFLSSDIPKEFTAKHQIEYTNMQKEYFLNFAWHDDTTEEKNE